MQKGEGLEPGPSERRASRLAGRPGGEIGSAAERRNVSTVGWVAIGVGGGAVAAAIWFVGAMNDASE